MTQVLILFGVLLVSLMIHYFVVVEEFANLDAGEVYLTTQLIPTNSALKLYASKNKVLYEGKDVKPQLLIIESELSKLPSSSLWKSGRSFEKEQQLNKFSDMINKIIVNNKISSIKPLSPFKYPPAPAAVVAKAAPKPVVAAPKPVVAAPKPVVAAPKPVVAAPKPVVAAAKPVVAAAKPVVAAPKPVVAAPKPVVAASKPVVAAPKPVVASTIIAPKPITTPMPSTIQTALQPKLVASTPIIQSAPIVSSSTPKITSTPFTRLIDSLVFFSPKGSSTIGASLVQGFFSSVDNEQVEAFEDEQEFIETFFSTTKNIPIGPKDIVNESIVERTANPVLPKEIDASVTNVLNQGKEFLRSGCKPKPTPQPNPPCPAPTPCNCPTPKPIPFPCNSSDYIRKDQIPCWGCSLK